MANIFYQSILLETVMHYTLCTVKVYIYIFLRVKASSPHACMLLVSKENAQRPTAAVLVYMGFVLFCVCVINWYLKNKKQQKPRLLFTDWKKITAFYTTEILSQDFAKQELGSSYFFAVDRVLCSFSSYGRVHKPRCAAIDFVYFHNFNCSKLHYILQSPRSICICLSFQLFQYKKGFNLSAGLLELFLLFYVIYWCGNLLLRTNCRQQINFIWTG